MRLLIASGIYPPEIGGPASYVPHLANLLIDRGHQVIVVAPLLRDNIRNDGHVGFSLIRYYRSKRIRFLNFFIENFLAISTLINASKGVDLIYSNGLDMPSFIVSKLRKIPLVIKVVGDSAWEFTHTRSLTNQNIEEYQNSNNQLDAIIKLYFRIPIQKADEIIVPSNYLKNIVKEWAVSTINIHVIYNALTEIPKPIPYQIEPAMMSNINLISAGRLIPFKCFNQIISCMPEIEEASLIIAGEGPEYINLSNLINELHLEKRVLLTRQISKGELFFLFQEFADAFILNSIYEGFPHVLLEAIYNQVPIIATKVGGTPELIKNNHSGLLIPPNQPAEILYAIKRLFLDHSLRQSIILNAQQLLDNFTTQNMVDGTISIFERTLS